MRGKLKVVDSNIFISSNLYFLYQSLGSSGNICVDCFKIFIYMFRDIEMPLPSVVPIQTLIMGYLKNEVPKVIVGNIMDYFIKPENLKLLTKKDGVAGSLAMTGLFNNL